MPKDKMIIDLLTDKTGEEKADIKSQEISKIGSVDRVNVKFSGADYDIQITEIKPIKGGVVVLAKAWDSNGQIGFGKDGSVDLERFIIMNPPILVADPLGDILKTWTDEISKTTYEKRYREDAQLALLQSLAHTIKVGEKILGSKNIISGKVGKTTATFYPSGSVGTSPADGMTRRSGVDEVYTTLYAGAGTSADDESSPQSTATLVATATTNQYSQCRRGIFMYDTSTLGSSASISSATLSLFGATGKTSGLGALDVSITAANPGATTDVVASDYQTVSNTKFATDIAGGSVSESAYNDWAFNASGIADISKTGVSKFACRLAKDVDNANPIWDSGANTQYFFEYAEASGTSSDPKLVVVYTTGGGVVGSRGSSDVVALLMH